jgi:hypothetical protein
MRIYTTELPEATARQGLLAEKTSEIERAQRDVFPARAALPAVASDRRPPRLSAQVPLL